MSAGWLLLAAVVFGSEIQADTAPFYSVGSVVNAADNQPGPLSPGAIATIYGSGLAFITKGISASDIHGGYLPIVLPGTGVHVLVGNIAAGIYYVSPNQINFLVPTILIPGASSVQVVRDGISGPLIPVQLAASSPAFFQSDPQTVIATHPDGSLVTPDLPAAPGEILVLYATGLGPVVPPVGNLEIPVSAAHLKQIADFRVTVDGTLLDASRVLYAGVSPGFGGLYQINLQLPDAIGPNPEIRAGLAGQISPAGLILPAKP